jgi:hypothetical protein
MIRLNRKKVWSELCKSVEQSNRDTNGNACIPADFADALEIMVNEYQRGMHNSLDDVFGLTPKKISSPNIRHNRIKNDVVRMMIDLLDKGVPQKANSTTAGAFEQVAPNFQTTPETVQRIWSKAINLEADIGTPLVLELFAKGYAKGFKAK